MVVAYCSFDVFPSPKGAATHIDAFARRLGAHYGHVDLVTLAATPQASSGRPWLDVPRGYAYAPGVTHHPIAAGGPNLIARAMSFRTQLAAWWRGRRPTVAHVRSIFEGYPIARDKAAHCDALVYEVNGLPSIELKYHYPAVAEDDELLAKLHAQEQRCIEAADMIITPSQVTADELARRGAGDIRVIMNGVDDELFRYRAPPSWLGRKLSLIYVGTMTSWQGVHHTLEALRLLRRDHPAELVLIGPSRKRQRRKLTDKARELSIAEHVQILAPVSRAELSAHYHNADVALVPLTISDRNTVQGCCPLKVIEAMACGVPIVASDLPVVSALARHGREATLVRAGSPKAIKDGILDLLRDPDGARRRAEAARARVEAELTWKIAGDALIEAYDSLRLPSLSSTPRSAASS